MRAAEKLSVTDCIADRVWLGIPQPAEWQGVTDQIKAAPILTRSDFVKVLGRGGRFARIHAKTLHNYKIMPCNALQIVVSFLGGGVTGSLLTYFLTRSTARESRKRDFLSFMRGWRMEVARDNPHKTANQFSAKVSLFEQEVEKISDDYSGGFEDLVKKLSSLRDSDVEEMSRNGNMIGRDRLLTAIDAVVNFVKTN